MEGTLFIKGHLQENPNKSFDKFSKGLISGCIDIYLKLSMDLLPVPSKCHYQFNIRDFSRVI